MTPKLSIIIVNWNTADLLKQCLESITQPLLPNIEIIVVDNGSTDDSVQEIKNQISNIKNKNQNLKLIVNDKNYGFSRGNNIGIKQAMGEYIMLLNSDTIVKPGALEKLTGFLDEHPEVSIVGPRLLNQDGTFQANCGWFPLLKVAFLMLFKEHFGGSNSVRFSPVESQVVDWLMGAAFVARREVFDKAGGLDEEIFMYMEEVEWFYRTRKLGFKTYFFDEAEIIHLGRGSSKSSKKEPIINIYKGLLHFYKKHRSKTETIILKLMLKLKALLTLFVGYLKKDAYLIETYGQALKIN